MKVTSVFLKPVTTGKTLKASGNVELDKALSLSFLVLEGKKGPFVSWKGTEQYDKKDGSGKGYSSPIFIKDEELRKDIDTSILNKYKVECGGAGSTPTPAAAGNGLTDAPPF